MIDDSDDDDDNGGIEKTWDTLMVIDDDVKPWCQSCEPLFDSQKTSSVRPLHAWRSGTRCWKRQERLPNNLIERFQWKVSEMQSSIEFYQTPWRWVYLLVMKKINKTWQFVAPNGHLICLIYCTASIIDHCCYVGGLYPLKSFKNHTPVVQLLLENISWELLPGFT